MACLAVAGLMGGCGGAVAAVSGVASSAHSTRYAPTPTSVGVVNPAAVPLGDGYVSSTPKVGYVDSCIQHFPTIGGAQVEGPWINSQARTWNALKKPAVGGTVRWPSARYKVIDAGQRRVIAFNDLPTDHTTGIFPVRSTDPAYAYDRNPNHIAARSFRWSLALHPRLAHSPSCTSGGPIGVLGDGVALYNALDGEGRDAGAHEVLDQCQGHPDMSSTYHHHAIPTCILDKARKGKTRLVGYALDGFGIYVVKNANGTLPGNRSLDACHGTTSRVEWDGKLRRIYHYVATLEYPYTVGCFRGTPIHVGALGGAPGGPPGR